MELPEGLMTVLEGCSSDPVLVKRFATGRSYDGCWLTSWAHSELVLVCRESLIKIFPK